MTNNIRNALKVFADLGVGSGPDHETETYQIERGAIRKARAVLVSELAAPAIKPLEWDEHGQADVYSVCRDIMRAERHYYMARGNKILGWFDDEEAAKAAAQADYEQRIRSALIARER